MLKVHRLGSELERLWTQILPKNPLTFPFSTYTWHCNWFTTLGKTWQPYILSVEEHVIAPFARQRNELIISGGQEGSDYLDLIGADPQKTAAWPRVFEYIKAQGIKRIELFNVPENSPTVTFFNKLREELPGKSAAEVIQEDTTPRLELPPTWAEYLTQLSRKARHELRRKLKKFDRDHPESTITTMTHPETSITRLLELMRLNPDKEKFLRPDMEDFFRRQLTDFTEHLWYLLLNVGSEPAAITVAFKSSETLLLYNSGFDEAKFSGAGFYLKAQSIKLAIEQRIKEYNLLQGHERYKYELGGKDFYVYSIKVAI